MSNLTVVTSSGGVEASQESRQENLETLKLDIKTWEKEFSKEHGHAPSKEDLKSLPWIHAKYKMYQKLKDELKRIEKLKEREKRKEEERKEREIAKKALQEESLQSVKTEADSESNSEPTFVAPYAGNPASRLVTPRTSRTIDVLGPTPQMNGRVLGLFEIRTPMTPNGKQDVRSPLKSGSQGTPSKTLVLTREIVNSSPTKSRATAISTPSKISITPTSLRVLGTPKSSNTPLYLSGAFVKESESPLAPRKVSRRLSSMITELQQMSDIEDYELDINDISEEDEDFDNKEMEQPKQLFKKKGQKRTTKRVISMYYLFECKHIM
jgi:DNA replication regulator SLD2